MPPIWRPGLDEDKWRAILDSQSPASLRRERSVMPRRRRQVLAGAASDA